MPSLLRLIAPILFSLICLNAQSNTYHSKGTLNFHTVADNQKTPASQATTNLSLGGFIFDAEEEAREKIPSNTKIEIDYEKENNIITAPSRDAILYNPQNPPPSPLIEEMRRERLHGAQLRQIIKHSLSIDPSILYAQAEIEVAEAQTEQAHSQHHPQISTFIQQNLHQYHRNSSNRTSDFTPGIRANLNLYSFGAIERQIDYYKSREQSSHYQLGESEEQLAYTIAELYINILSGIEQKKALEGSRKRIERIMRDLEIITSHDAGRLSELVQAQARHLNLSQQIHNSEREIEIALNRLARYTLGIINPDTLTDPFSNINLESLKQNYTAKHNQNQRLKYLEQELITAEADVQATRAERYPQINLVGQATRDDRSLYIEMAWEAYDRSQRFDEAEKVARIRAAQSQIDNMRAQLTEDSASALINYQQYQALHKTLQAQIKTQKEVIDFYQLQFSIARRTLLELLNAEQELLSSELSAIQAEFQTRFAILNYLYAQGTLKQWIEE